MISHGKDIKVFSGNANPKLAEEIRQFLIEKISTTGGIWALIWAQWS